MPRLRSRTPMTVRLAASFREDYDLLDARDRGEVDHLVRRLQLRVATGSEAGEAVTALDEYRLMRSLRVTDDTILTVTDGRVSLDVLCRSDPAEVIVLGAAGRDAVMPLTDEDAPALAS